MEIPKYFAIRMMKPYGGQHRGKLSALGAPYQGGGTSLV
jgi:hypothetical protein